MCVCVCMCIVNIFLPQSVGVAKNSPVTCMLKIMCVKINPDSEALMWVPPPPLQQSSNKNMQTLNMKSEANRRKT